MKKGWKIALIALGAVVGLVAVTVAVAMWLIFTPTQLTRIVNKLAGDYVTCETSFGRVNLTLFKTFPDAGLTIDDVCVVNPVAGIADSQVAHIGNLTVGIDVGKYLKEKEVVVHQVLLDDVEANLYTDTAGNSNFDIFPHSEKKKDKKPFSLDSLPNIDLRKVKISHLDASLRNDRNRLEAACGNLVLTVTGQLDSGWIDAHLDLKCDSLRLLTRDTAGAAKINTSLEDTRLALKAKGNLDQVAGNLNLKVRNGLFGSKGKEMVNERLYNSKKELLALAVPFSADLQAMHFDLGKTALTLDAYSLGLEGGVQLKQGETPLGVDVALWTDGAWQAKPLLDLLPERWVKFRKGMDLDAKVTLSATAKGPISKTEKPKIDATVKLADGRFHYPKAVAYKVERISADLHGDFDFSKGGRSDVRVNSLKARTQGTRLELAGNVTDITHNLGINARLKGTLPLTDLKPVLPKKLPLDAQGDAEVALNAGFTLKQLKAKAYDKMKLTGTVKFGDLNVRYDSIRVESPDLQVALCLPARKHQGKTLDAHITGSSLKFARKSLATAIEAPDINLGVNNVLKEQLAAAVELAVGKSGLTVDSTQVALNTLSLNGSVRFDSTQANPLKKYNPLLDIDLRNASVVTSALPETLYLDRLDFVYKPEQCEIRDAQAKLGNSDFQLYGAVQELEKWLSHEAMLTGDLNFKSGYADVDQLMAMFSGKGSDPDTLAQMRQEDKVPKDANPFIVPKDVDLTLHTHIRRSLAFGNDLGDLAGAVTVKDGTAILDQIGFVCKAATMQLTALYRSPRPNNIFVALDFHLLDIQIDELIDMIPTVDTLVPMLSAFDGNANFHLAGEGFLNARYKPKMSTILGSAAISGTNLTVLDNNSIAQIAKLMQFKEWKDKDNKIRIDSLSVEMTCLRREIEVFPFLLNIGKYQICASGKHNLSGDCGYHLELLKNPLMAKVGVDIQGTLKNPQIKLGEVRYADIYKPDKRGEAEKRALEMKRMVREALENNVR